MKRNIMLPKKSFLILNFVILFSVAAANGASFDFASWLDYFGMSANSQATFTVNSTLDTPDADTSDGACDDGAGNCTLRAAIQQANASAGADSIGFNISGGNFQSIAPATALPAITDTITIDGYTQPGASANSLEIATNAVLLIEIRGNAIPSGFNHGLRIDTNNSTVKGLIVNRFSDSGIFVNGGGNIIEGNYVGTDSIGVSDLGNAFDGISIFGSNNTVGGTTAATRNVVSGNNRHGIVIQESTGNKIKNNYVGTNSLGNGALANSENGIHFFRASNNTIGGVNVVERNLISGNGDNGIYFFADTLFQTPQANTVIGNFIGTNAFGNAAIANSENGVYLLGSKNNNIGSANAGEGNLISGNTQYGVRIEGSNATGNQIRGNLIGTKYGGNEPLANGSSGVLIYLADSNTIGGTTDGARNVISGNTGDGVSLAGIAGDFAENNSIKGNYIGTSYDNLTAVANSTGISALRAVSNQIGGTGTGEGNVISGNSTGIHFRKSLNNTFQGNIIGLSKITGNALPNAGHGVSIAEGGDNIINGGNYVSGNQTNGIILWDGTSNNIVRGNFIGINPANQARGNVENGIAINDGSGNQIGGVGAGEGNLIANNNRGVYVLSGENNRIRGNSIFNATALGIDLGFEGTNTNDPQDSDFGANGLQNFPVLEYTLVKNGVTNIKGSLGSAPNQTFTLDFYSTVNDPFAEGQTHFGATEVTTDAGGQVSFNLQFNVDTNGKFITATATDASGNTSEFSSSVRASNSFIVSTIGDSGFGSLRQAIIDANNFPGADTITFNIPFNTQIYPATALPVITEAVTIDGYSQPGASVNTSETGFNANLPILIGGNNGLAIGLVFNAGGSTVRGLYMTSFSLAAIQFQQGDGNTIEGCVIRNAADGVEVFTANNHIGGTTLSKRNVISQNSNSGVYVNGANADGNLIRNNIFGTVNSFGGNKYGVYLFGSKNTTVGGASAAERNYFTGNTNGVRIENSQTTATISGNWISNSNWGVSLSNNASGIMVSGNTIFNNQRGINLDFGASGNSIKGNTIGINPSGSMAPNQFGVNIDGEGGATNNNIVGGSAPGEGNTIHNNTHGVVVYTGAGGAASGNRISGNSIFNNSGLGIDLGFNNVTVNDSGDGDTGPNNLQNFPNLIGAVPSGANSIVSGTLNSAPNSTYTIEFFASPTPDQTNFGEGRDYIGSTTATTDANGNATFSGTVPLIAAGMRVTATATDASGNTSEFSRMILAARTFVVTNANDAGANTLRQAVIDAESGPGTDVITFNIAGAGQRLINLNSQLPPVNDSLIVDGYTQPGASPNSLQTGDNAVILIHVRNNGTVPYAFGLFNSGSTIRGLQISNFAQQGIGINFTSSNNVIEGNWITGNFSGVDVFGANNRIGGTTPAQRNVINGNTANGVRIAGGSAGNNVVQNNYIGTDFSGTASVPNANGVLLSNDAANNTIGGTTTGMGNLIAFNNGAGVIILDVNTINNRISGNSIHSNTGLGIDLGGDGVTANDAGDADLANNLQNFPVINTIAGTIQATLNSTPNTTFRIEFFDNAAPDPTGYGEGKTFIGSRNVTTDANGDAVFTYNPPIVVPPGRWISATATDPNGNTGEFSEAKQVLAPTAAGAVISGRISMADGDQMLKTTVTLLRLSNGAEITTTTNSKGIYRFKDLPVGEQYIVSVKREGFVFNPPQQFVSLLEDNLNIDFSGFEVKTNESDN